MKTSILATAIVAALWVPIASAEDDKPMSAKPAMNMDAGKPAQQPATATASGMNMGTDKQGAAAQPNMDKMQRQMDKITTTTDPKARQKLMEEHMQTMQENMKTMRGMGNAKMKDGHGGMAMGDKKDGASSDMQKRQDMSDTRMDMMQQMMEQMMERDKASKPMGHM